jgi:hypothetical protein
MVPPVRRILLEHKTKESLVYFPTPAMFKKFSRSFGTKMIGKNGGLKS